MPEPVEIIMQAVDTHRGVELYKVTHNTDRQGAHGVLGFWVSATAPAISNSPTNTPTTQMSSPSNQASNWFRWFFNWLDSLTIYRLLKTCLILAVIIICLGLIWLQDRGKLFPPKELKDKLNTVKRLGPVEFNDKAAATP